MRYCEPVVVRVKLFSLVFVRTHRLASPRKGGRETTARKREKREEKKRRGRERRIKVEE